MSKFKKMSFNRKAIVSVLLAAAFVSLLNQTLLIVALPPIMDEFRIGPAKAHWLTTIYMLIHGIMIPISASLINKYSSKALLIMGIGIFTFGTLLGAIAPSFSILLFARIFQAAGSGILMPLMQTVLMTIYPPEKRGAVMGMCGLVIGFAPAIGPTLSGYIIDQFAWRYLFYTVLPIAICVLLLAIFFMKNITEQTEVKLDKSSIILSTLGWGGLLYGFSIIGSVNFGDKTLIASLVIGTITLTLFVLKQRQLKTPILDFRVFQSKEFTITTILSVLRFTLMIGVQTILPLYIQNVRGGSAVQAGGILFPGAIIAGIMAPISGKLFDKYGARGLTVLGFSMVFLSTILFMNLGMETPIYFVTIIFFIKMLGIGLLMTPIMTSGINALPFELIAHGTATHNTVRIAGSSIGTALIVSVMTAKANATSSINPSINLLEGIQTAFFVTGIAAFIGLILSFSLQKTPKSHNCEKLKLIQKNQME